LKAVRREIELAHGQFPGARVAIAGMGKLGSREMTAGSDVDIILLYDYDSDAHQSDGPKPLDASRYFIRLTQKLMAALSAPTAEGVLYEVDMRLRPSGNQGPLATRINTFEKYQKQEAWTWEHMALTRCRVLCGDESLVEEARRIVGETLGVKRDISAIGEDVAEMRGLIEQEKPSKSIWDFKLLAGGLVDIEFIAQYLTLIAPTRGLSVLDVTSTKGALEIYGRAFLNENNVAVLLEAFDLYTRLSQIIRFCTDNHFDPEEAPAGLVDLVCKAADCPDVSTLESEVKRLSAAVRAIFDDLVQPDHSPRD
jgi:glutamate-ammonia-ligase adenylyltransferase